MSDVVQPPGHEPWEGFREGEWVELDPVNVEHALRRGRLDWERQAFLEPRRMASCKADLEEMGYEVTAVDLTRLDFMYKGSRIMFWPYSGWHTGKTIEDGRGFEHLVSQL